MISEVQADRVAIVRSRDESPVRLGGDSFLGPTTEFLVEMAGASSPVVAVHGLRAPREPGGGGFMGQIAGAVRARARKLERSPSAWTQAGFAALAARDLEAARHSFEAALELAPESRNARMGLARTAHDEGLPEEARELLRDLLARSPGDTEAVASLALVLVSEGNLREALALLEGATPSEAAKYAPLLAARGGIHFLLGDARGAVSDLRKAVRLKPDWVQARTSLGLAELKLGRASTAERHFRAALRVGPLNTGASLNLVGFLCRARRWEDALAIVDRYWKPGAAPVALARYAAEACFALDSPRGARDWLAGALDEGQRGDERAAILNNLGVAYSELDLSSDAENAFLQSIEEIPSATAVANRGKILLETGDIGRAIHWLQGWWERPELRSRDVGVTLAAALSLATRHEDAIRLATELESRPDADEKVFGFLSVLYADGVHDYAAASRYASAGLEKWPESVSLKNNLSYSLLMAGRPTEAARYLDSIDDSVVDHQQRAFVTATRGLLRLWQGDLKEGLRLYELASVFAGRRALRERVKAKRDLEHARALLRLGEERTVPHARALLRRAGEAGAAAEPYATHARSELRRLQAGENSVGDRPEGDSGFSTSED